MHLLYHIDIKHYVVIQDIKNINILNIIIKHYYYYLVLNNIQDIYHKYNSNYLIY
jgi:hypothetical protein